MLASYDFENYLRNNGSLLVCGIDEVGRGSLAGPLVVAAVILPYGCKLELKDSKLLSSKKRQALSELIKNQSLGYGIGIVSSDEIDIFGLTYSTELACVRALCDMKSFYNIVLIDGNINYLRDYDSAIAVVKADSKIACVAAASILAKVFRDDYMAEISVRYPLYEFQNNVGYGTKSHREALNKYGASDIHRKSFLGNILQ